MPVLPERIPIAVALPIIFVGLWLVGIPSVSPNGVPEARASWLAQVSEESEPSGAATDALHAMEQTVLDLINLDRDRHGLGPLAPDTDLMAAARHRALAQVDLPRLSHYDAEGKIAIANILAEAGLPYLLAGENLVRVWGDVDQDTALRAHDALMLSPGHNANILEPLYNRVAIGAVTDGRGYVIFAEIFRSAPD